MNGSNSLVPSSASASASSSSSEPRIECDVFLSFRGEDTRYSFTGHLYNGLDRKGIRTFKDENDLERGKPISPKLLKTIESSRCSVVVLSRNYATSRWCLDELVKIVECMKDHKQIVLPIFYHVDPSDVRKQTGSFGEAFEKHIHIKKVRSWWDALIECLGKHEQVFSHNPEKVRSWRDALTEVSNLAGWELRDRVDEADFIEHFSKHVSKRLGVGVESTISEDLVGLNSRVKELDDLVGMNSRENELDDVRFIGIYAMGGMGKTTLAKEYEKLMSSKFEGSSFLANVREVCEKKKNGLVELQKKLLSEILSGFPKDTVKDDAQGKDMIRSRLCNKKVLIILDDVDQLDQLNALAEKDNWFGSGSRIIITTRDESLLTATYKDYTIYRLKQLNDNEGLHLFSKKAFKSSHCPEDYRELSEQVIAYAKGLPLALQVLGSFLRGKSIEEWESAMHRLMEYPEKKIVDVLQISFDALQETEKYIFLDIACFFNGYDKDEIIQIMDSCGFHPKIGIRTLIDKSLIHNGPNNRLRMHDLLQEMGKEIVREKSRKEPGRRSRIWNLSDLQHVMEKNTGTDQVEAIVVDSSDASDVLGWEALSNMKKLRILWLIHLFETKNVLSPIAYLSNELRIFNWKGFPFASLPSSFQPDGLVELKLSESKIRHLWNNRMKPLNSLKILDMSYSLSFRKVEDFRVVPNLEKLILCGCEGLVEVHPSITLLTSLTLLDLTLCKSLENLPTSMKGLKSLQVLNLICCERLGKLPEDLGHLSSLEELHVKGTGLRCLPSTLVLLKNLKILSCGGLENMLNIIVGKGLISGCLYSLKKLDLSLCGLRDGAIPEDFGCLASLEELNLRDNYFSSLPACISQLSKLRILDLRECEDLKSLGAEELPPSLELVRVDECTSLDTFLDPLNDQCKLRCCATCVGCTKLVRRQGSKKTAFASLKRYLQNPPNPSEMFYIVLPGKEIPTWFTCRNSGQSRSISLQVNPNLLSKWMGFAFCVISSTNFWPSPVRIKVQGFELKFVEKHVPFKSLQLRYSRRDHLWLFYVPRDACFEPKWQNNCSQVEFTVESMGRFASHEYNGCGGRLVYEQDIQDLNLHNEDADGEGDGDGDSDADRYGDGDSDADTDGDVQGNESSNWR